MKQEHVVKIALFMIYLVVMLPIIVSESYAATIHEPIEVYGSFGKVGYRGYSDTTTISVRVSLPEEPTLEGSQLKRVEDPTKPFECTPEAEGSTNYNCLLQYGQRMIDVSNPIHRYTLQLFDDAENALTTTKQAYVIVDHLPPKLRENVTYSSLPGGLVKANYAVEDVACNDARCAGKCSGMQSIIFTVGGLNVGQQIEFNDECRQNGEINITGLVSGEVVEEKSVCIELKDNFDQVKTECGLVTIDTKPPVVTSIGLYDNNDRQITSVNGIPKTNLKLKFEIEEDSGLFHPTMNSEDGEGIVWVNASSVTERLEHKAAFENKDVVCDFDGDKTYSCEIDNIFFVQSTARSIPIKIKAKDQYDNSMDTEQVITLIFDNSPPRLEKIYSNYENDLEEYFVGSNTTIITDIAEEGAGMNNRQIILDMVLLGATGDTTLQFANYCEPGWTCKWYDRVPTRESGSVIFLELKSGSADDAGNPFVTPAPSGRLIVDTQPPTQTESLSYLSNITGIGESHPRAPYLVTGDVMEIHQFVMDHSGVKSAKANFSEVIELGDNEAIGECSEVDIDTVESLLIGSEYTLEDDKQRVFDCVWYTDVVKEGYRDDLQIRYTFEDYADNIGDVIDEDIEILGMENETGIRWDITVLDSTPSNGIDRMSWPLAAHRMFYKLEFNPYLYGESGVLNVVSIILDPYKCSNLEYLSVDPYTNEFLIDLAGYADIDGEIEGEFNDILMMYLNPDNVPPHYTEDEYGNTQELSEIEINCTFEIQSIIDDDEKRLTLPEPINVTFEIPVYNNPLGENIGNVQDLIEEEEDYVSNGWLKFMTSARKVLEWAKAICQTLESIVSIIQLFSSAKEIFTGMCNVPATSGTGCPAAQGVGQTTETSDGLGQKIYKFFYFTCGLLINCKLTAEAEQYLDTDCSEESSSASRAWCNIKKWWARLNRGWAESMNLYIGGESGVSYGASVLTSGAGANTNENVEGRGASLFNVQDADPSRSIVSSVLTLCIPGIIENLDRIRQIKCKRLLCLKIDVPNGRPMWHCEASYSYQMCKFWVGQAFAAFPIVQYIEQIGDVIESFFENPTSMLLGMVVEKTCSLMCRNDRLTGCSVCKILQWFSSLTTVVTDLIMNTGDRFKGLGFDMCEEALKDEPSYDNLDWNRGEIDTGE